MRTANSFPFRKLPPKQAKFIKSLRLKKYRLKENAFLVEGAKNVQLLLASRYVVRIIVGTPTFLKTHSVFKEYESIIFQTDENTLTLLGTFSTNKTVLAVASIPATYTSSAPPNKTWGLVLDGINDPGNLGTILRIADWYNIPALICSLSTVDLYNPKVLHASMGSFINVQVHYTTLPTFLNKTPWPILGASTTGNSIHRASLPFPGLIVIGNEARGISSSLLPYIQQNVSIPRYGQAESLNAAMAAAIVCDHWRHQHQKDI